MWGAAKRRNASVLRTRTPPTEPSFFPSPVLNSSPTQTPVENCTQIDLIALHRCASLPTYLCLPHKLHDALLVPRLGMVPHLGRRSKALGPPCACHCGGKSGTTRPPSMHSVPVFTAYNKLSRFVLRPCIVQLSTLRSGRKAVRSYLWQKQDSWCIQRWGCVPCANLPSQLERICCQVTPSYHATAPWRRLARRCSEHARC